MMPTDLASVAPAGRDMRTSEADLASMVETTWHERSPRPNHGSLPGAEASALERLTAHATVKRGRASGRDAEHSYCGQSNKRFTYHVLLLRLQCLDAFAYPLLGSSSTNRRIKSPGFVFVPADHTVEYKCHFLTCKSACQVPFARCQKLTH
jgi:hypothetical protein